MVFYFFCLCACFKQLILERAVPQQADTAEGKTDVLTVRSAALRLKGHFTRRKQARSGLKGFTELLVYLGIAHIP